MILRMKDHHNVTTLMSYPLDPERKYFSGISDISSKPIVTGFLSQKLANATKNVIVGNFLKTEFLLNATFGIRLIDFMLQYDINITSTDPFIQKLINERTKMIAANSNEY